MEGLRSIFRETRIQKRREIPARTNTAQTPPPEADRVELSAGTQVPAAESAAARLRGLFAGVNFTFGSLGGDDLYQYAAAAGSGMHLTLSQEFLEAMAQDEEAWQAGVALIQDTLNQLGDKVAQKWKDGRAVIGAGAVIGADGVDLWTTSPPEDDKISSLKRMIEQMEEARKKAKERALKQKKSVDANPRELMARLVRAEVQQSARDVLIAAGHKVLTLQMAVAMGDQYDQAKVRAALSQMKRVVTRARSKIRKLDEEQLMRSREKRAERERQYKQARELRAELYKRKAIRRAKEYARLNEPQEYEEKRTEQQIRRELENAEMEAMSQAMDVTADIVGADAGVMVESGGVSVEVDVSTVDVSA